MVKSALKGYLAIILAAFIFAIEVLISKIILNNNINPLLLAFYKVIGGAISLLIIMMIFRVGSFKLKKEDFIKFIIQGTVGVGVFSYSLLTAIKLTNVSTAVILLQTAPIFTVLLAGIFLKEKIDFKKTIAIILAFAGSILVIVGYNLSNLEFSIKGVSYGILAGLCSALYNLLSKKNVENSSPWTINFYSVFVAAIFLGMIINPMTIVNNVLINPENLQYAFVLGFMQYGLGCSLFVYGLKHVEASKGSIVGNLEPVVSVILAGIIFKEALLLPQIIGFILILSGILIITIKYQKVQEYLREEI